MYRRENRLLTRSSKQLLFSISGQRPHALKDTSEVFQVSYIPEKIGKQGKSILLMESWAILFKHVLYGNRRCNVKRQNRKGTKHNLGCANATSISSIPYQQSKEDQHEDSSQSNFSEVVYRATTKKMQDIEPPNSIEKKACK